MTKQRIRRPKHSLEEIQLAFSINGDKLLTKHYANSKQRLTYKCGGCKKNRIIAYNNYSRGTRCKFCVTTQRAGKGNPKRLNYLNLKDRLYQLSEVARMLHVDYDDLRNLINQGLLPEGSKKLGVKLYYTDKDIKEIKKKIRWE